MSLLEYGPMEGAMALTDIALRELRKRTKRGENIAMKSDGGGLNVEAGRYWRFTFDVAGKEASGPGRLSGCFLEDGAAGARQSPGTLGPGHQSL